MKILKNLSLAVVATLILAACSSDDDAPLQVNEEELITTTIVTMTSSGNPTVTLTARDLDGDGPNPVQTTVSGNLVANATYSGTVQVLNETESPAEDITEEVAEEDEEHQFFYQVGGSLNLTTTYTDMDADGNPVGITFSATTGDASTGTFTVTLRHEPNKGASGVANGDITNAGGETDVTQTFDLTIQ